MRMTVVTLKFVKISLKKNQFMNLLLERRIRQRTITPETQVQILENQIHFLVNFQLKK